ncbi:hypothetical protein [Paracidovorax avenae]|uniref:hypothetical protein n=1 Tax=Paracidovorax avenae TaxID=80867 RepID=UPI001CEF85A7|nr:hypothetical protein [Paracidovorax avenae]
MARDHDYHATPSLSLADGIADVCAGRRAVCHVLVGLCGWCHRAAFGQPATPRAPVAIRKRWVAAGRVHDGAGLGTSFDPERERQGDVFAGKHDGGSLCTLDGTIDGDQGIARQDGGRSSCVVGFGHSAQGIDVKAATLAECRDFCGFNGSFAGRYVRVKEGCGRDEVDRTRATFQRLYDRRNFKAALAILSPVLENCSVTLDWEDEGAIRNDLAITQYRNGLHAQCLATLARYAGDAAKDDDAAADGWAPALAERYLDIVRAARTNIGLCRKGAQKRAP